MQHPMRFWGQGSACPQTAPSSRLQGDSIITLAEAIYQHSLNLPESAAREALDFVEFLERRYAMPPGVTKTVAGEEKRKAALDHLAALRIEWEGKPIPDRNALYEDARGTSG